MKTLRTLLIFAACSAFSCLIGCGGGSSSSTPANTVASSGTNVTPIIVNSGPTANYVNGGFATVSVCIPGTSTCQSIDGVLVDTGSVGLRILSTALTVALPQQKASDGNPLAECLQFVDSYTWGPVQAADVQIGGEKAGSLPIQVLSDSEPGFTVPTSSCTSSGMSADTLATLGANGILGVGQFPQDCGSPCPATANMYYECPSSGCVSVAVSLAQEVQNPVSLFATDNNGVIIELPAVSGAEASLSGSLVFGIGTESNNALGGATIYTVDPATGNFSTTFDGQSFSDASFIDSGSNGYFFPSTITQCSQSLGFYCPSSTTNLSATNQGNNGTSGTVNFSVGNADTLFDNNPTDFVFGNLGGPASGSFDWGLPFFFGRNVYTAIYQPTGTIGATPYWAY